MIKERPNYEGAPNPVQLVGLFTGGGGLTVGVAEAARRVGRGMEVALAVENDDDAADVYALNFPRANLVRADIETLFDGELGTRATASERSIALAVGDVDILVAGPPCQGHSDLNNHTRRQDPRNALYLRAVRAVEVLQPTLVVIENVPAVRHDKGGVVALSTQALKAAGYSVDSGVLDLVKLGVPQRRRRHILLAAVSDRTDLYVMGNLGSACDEHHQRSVRWAIKDLVDQTAASGPDAASRPTPVSLERMQWQIDQNEYNLPNAMRPKCHHDAHTYNSMCGRLAWDAPAQTITTGFGSMGQGRFVHLAKPRTITPHEAARLQTLPDFVDLDTRKGRGAWARVIGNAVLPLFGVHLISPLLGAPPCRGEERHERPGLPSARFLTNYFHNIVRSRLAESELTIESLHRALVERGCAKSRSTVRSWVTGRTLAPEQFSDLEKLNDALDLRLSPQRLCELFAGVQRCRGARRAAGRVHADAARAAAVVRDASRVDANTGTSMAYPHETVDETLAIEMTRRERLAPLVLLGRSASW